MFKALLISTIATVLTSNASADFHVFLKEKSSTGILKEKDAGKNRNLEARKYRDQSGLTEKEKLEVINQVKKELVGEQKNGEVRIAGNGGDPDLQAIEKLRQVIRQVNDKQPQRLRIPLMSDLLDQALSAQVLISDKMLLLDGVRKAAINFPELNLMIFDRELFREMNEREQLFLVFHETLGLQNLDLRFEITSAVDEETQKLLDRTLLSVVMSSSLIRSMADIENERRLCIEGILKETMKATSLGSKLKVREVLNEVLRTEFQIGESHVSSGYYILQYRSFQAMDINSTSRVAGKLCRSVNSINECSRNLTSSLSQILMKRGGCK